ncbi:MAG: BLUF domain-containing protein [Janthinobacterium lividum]
MNDALSTVPALRPDGAAKRFSRAGQGPDAPPPSAAPALGLTYVVEDDPIAAALARRRLETIRPGGRVHTHPTGQHALDCLAAALRTGAELPDLILLDLNMPQMDGWEFLDAFERLPLPRPTCVLVLTSSIDPADRAKAARYRAVAGYLAKPLDATGAARLWRSSRAGAGAAAGGALHHLVYQSSATVPMSEAELTRLLAHSRAHNATHGITGLLLHHDGRFVQLLEGGEAAVRAVFARIARDLRHAGVVTLADGPAAHRRFAEWSMAFRAVDRAALATLTGYTDPDRAEGFAGAPEVPPDPGLGALLAICFADPNWSA